ncbi:hypothetical protein BH09SUM1_BH09SUM1_21960 [soil metagenome]
MRDFERKIAAVRGRLKLFRVLDWCIIALIASMSAMALAMLVLKFIPDNAPILLWGGITVGAAVITTAIAALIKKTTMFEAALMADARMNLRERLSSALVLSGMPNSGDPAMIALNADAETFAKNIDPSRDFRYKAPGYAKHTIWPAIAIAALYFAPEITWFQNASKAGIVTKVVTPETPTERKVEAEKIRELAKQIREKKPGEDATTDDKLKLAANLEKLSEDLSLGRKNSKQALAEMSRMNDDLKIKQRDVSKQMQPFREIKGLQQAEQTQDLLKSLKDQDFEQAAQKMQQLAKMMGDPSKMSAEDKQQLAKELQQLSNDLKENKQLSDALQQAAQAVQQAAQAQQQQQPQSQQQNGQQNQQASSQNQNQNQQQQQAGQNQQNPQGQQNQQQQNQQSQTSQNSQTQQQQQQQAQGLQGQQNQSGQQQQQQAQSGQQSGQQQQSQQSQQAAQQAASALQQASQAMSQMQGLQSQMNQLAQMQSQMAQAQSGQQSGQRGQQGQAGQPGQGQQGQGMQPGSQPGQGSQPGKGQGQPGQNPGQGQGMNGQGQFQTGQVQSQGMGSGGPGRGMGGQPPDDGSAATGWKDTFIPGTKNDGEIIAIFEVEGTVPAGESKLNYTRVPASVKQKAADSIQDTEIPAGLRNSVRDYFQSIELGKNAPPAKSK